MKPPSLNLPTPTAPPPPPTFADYRVGEAGRSARMTAGDFGGTLLTGGGGLGSIGSNVGYKTLLGA